MVKLVALYRNPANAEEFEKHYTEVHMPLVEKIPGLLKTEVAMLKGFPGQEIKYFKVTEMYFESLDSLNAGMASAEGKASARDLMSFAKDYVEMYIGEIK
ncbi:MAG: EthD family reductase [Ignavibacteriae bacterium]|nr:MAG: EthD family reductase [Ignavibacteriota bacterium]